MLTESQSNELKKFFLEPGEIELIEGLQSFNIIDVLIRNSNNLRTYGFSNNQILTLAQGAFGSENIVRVVDMFRKLKSIGKDIAWVMQNYSKDDGVDRLTQELEKINPPNTTNDNSKYDKFSLDTNIVSNLGFDQAQLDSMIRSVGGASYLNSLIKLKNFLRIIGFTLENIASISRYRMAANTIELLKTRYKELKEFTPEQLVAMTTHHFASTAMEMMLNRKTELIKHGCNTTERLTKLCSNHAGETVIIKFLTYQQQFRDKGFDVDQVIKISGDVCGNVNPQRLLQEYDWLKNKFSTNEEIIKQLCAMRSPTSFNIMILNKNAIDLLGVDSEEIYKRLSMLNGKVSCVRESFLKYLTEKMLKLPEDKRCQIITSESVEEEDQPQSNIQKTITPEITYQEITARLTINLKNVADKDDLVFAIQTQAQSGNLTELSLAEIDQIASSVNIGRALSLVKYFKVLRNLSFTKDQILAMVKNQKSGDSLCLIVDNYNLLRENDWNNEDITSMARSICGKAMIDTLVIYLNSNIPNIMNKKEIKCALRAGENSRKLLLKNHGHVNLNQLQKVEDDEASRSSRKRKADDIDTPSLPDDGIVLTDFSELKKYISQYQSNFDLNILCKNHQQPDEFMNVLEASSQKLREINFPFQIILEISDKTNRLEHLNKIIESLNTLYQYGINGTMFKIQPKNRIDIIKDHGYEADLIARIQSHRFHEVIIDVICQHHELLIQSGFQQHDIIGMLLDNTRRPILQKFLTFHEKWRVLGITRRLIDIVCFLEYSREEVVNLFNDHGEYIIRSGFSMTDIISFLNNKILGHQKLKAFINNFPVLQQAGFSNDEILRLARLNCGHCVIEKVVQSLSWMRETQTLPHKIVKKFEEKNFSRVEDIQRFDISTINPHHGMVGQTTTNATLFFHPQNPNSSNIHDAAKIFDEIQEVLFGGEDTGAGMGTGMDIDAFDHFWDNGF